MCGGSRQTSVGALNPSRDFCPPLRLSARGTASSSLDQIHACDVRITTMWGRWVVRVALDIADFIAREDTPASLSDPHGLVGVAVEGRV